jgi:hypothetical protein
MERGSRLESMLVVDCGSATTRVALIDLVADEYRLVGRGETATTVEPPWSRISLGVKEAIRQLERRTGRMFLSQQEELIVPERENGSGVDSIVATVNAALPLRVGIVGLIREFSVDSLLKAAECSYVVVDTVVARDEMISGVGTESGELMVTDIFKNRPDAILLAGGTDGGALTPVVEAARDLAAVLASSAEGGRVHVVFAGNNEARSEVARVLGECSDLRVVDNVRPGLQTEDLGSLEEEISTLYREVKMARAPGYGELRSWAAVPVITTAEGFDLVLRYLAALYELDAVAVDVGSTATHVAGIIDGRYRSTVRPGSGVGYSIGKVLDEVGLDRILRWLPLEVEPGWARNLIANKALRPMSIPETEEDLLLEQAVAREAMILARERAQRRWLQGDSSFYKGFLPPVDLIIGRGGVLAEAPSVGQAALMLLDGMQPTGVCTLALDQYSLLPPLGALASVQPVAAAQALARDGLLRLGTVVALTGRGTEGSLALKLKVEYDDGRTLTAEVPYGALEVIPLIAGSRAMVELRPATGFDIGLASEGKGATTQVEGGALGLIVDARGRPLLLPEDDVGRRAKIREWMTELAG